MNEVFLERRDQRLMYASAKFLKITINLNFKMSVRAVPLRCDVLGVGRILSTSLQLWRILKPNAKHSLIDTLASPL